MSTKFTKHNTPPGYYVYLFLRADYTPYYVGKGKGGRAWGKRKGTKQPIDSALVIVIAWDLSETEAFILERKYIRWFGRKDIGTGILHNKTDGGDGLTNPSEEMIRRSVEKRSWYKQPMGEKHHRYGKTPVINVVTGEKLIVNKNDPRYKIYPYMSNNGALKGESNPRYIHTKYKFENITTGEIVEMTPNEFQKQYNIPSALISGLINGRTWKGRDWIIQGTVKPTPKPRKAVDRSAKNNPRFDDTVYQWENMRTGTREHLTGFDLIKKYPELSASDISDMKKNPCIRKRWRLVREEQHQERSQIDYRIYEWENLETGQVEIMPDYQMRGKYPCLTTADTRYLKSTPSLKTRHGWRLKKTLEQLQPKPNKKLRPNKTKGRTRPQTSGKNNGKYDHTIYRWRNDITGEILDLTGNEFQKVTGTPRSRMNNHKHGRSSKCGDWRIIR